MTTEPSVYNWRFSLCTGIPNDILELYRTKNASQTSEQYDGVTVNAEKNEFEMAPLGSENQLNPISEVQMSILAARKRNELAYGDRDDINYQEATNYSYVNCYPVGSVYEGSYVGALPPLPLFASFKRIENRYLFTYCFPHIFLSHFISFCFILFPSFLFKFYFIFLFPSSFTILSFC